MFIVGVVRPNPPTPQIPGSPPGSNITGLALRMGGGGGGGGGGGDPMRRDPGGSISVQSAVQITTPTQGEGLQAFF